MCVRCIANKYVTLVTRIDNIGSDHCSSTNMVDFNTIIQLVQNYTIKLEIYSKI